MKPVAVGASVAWPVDDLGNGRLAGVHGVVEAVDGTKAKVRPYAGQAERVGGGAIRERSTEPVWLDVATLTVVP